MKEGSSPHRAVVLGVRAAESQNRKDAVVAELWGHSRKDVTQFDFDNGDERIIAPCQQKAEIKIQPIVDWTESDVWSFLQDTKVEMNPVYSLGFHRVGCIGCPLAGKGRFREFRTWPAFERLYRNTFGRMLQARQPPARSTPGTPPMTCSGGGWRTRISPGSWTCSAVR